jgi:hypothetical protein
MTVRIKFSEEWIKVGDVLLGEHLLEYLVVYIDDEGCVVETPWKKLKFLQIPWYRIRKFLNI